MKNMLQATREPLDLDLKVIEGELPKDIYGYVFINSACGTANSGGLPITPYLDADRKKHNPDFGAAMLCGDSKILRINFDQEAQKVTFKSRLLYVPDLVADMATAAGGPAEHERKYKHFKFHNSGFGRINLALGSRNQINTAIIPFRHKGEETNRLYATIDAGRPYEFDPVELTLKQPVGWMKDWTDTVPSFMNKPLPILFSNAHPVYDPITYDFFIMNFSKSTETLLGAMHFSDTLTDHPELVKKEMEQFTKEYDQAKTYEERVALLQKLYGSMNQRVRKHLTARQKWTQTRKAGARGIRKLVHRFFGNKGAAKDQVFLINWDPIQGKMKKWRVVDEAGDDIAIVQVMHQISITKDYLILMDCSFKFCVDQMFSFPLESNMDLMRDLDRLIRDHTTVKQEPFTDVYIIKRSDLEEGSVVKAKKIVMDNACLHFNADYENPDGKITIYTANNNANCGAEWLRPYDVIVNPNTGDSQPVDPDWLSYFAIGNMDVCSLGKYVADYEAGKWDEEATKLCTETGDMDNPHDPGAHTWGLALHTYKDIISPTQAPSNLKNIYWQGFGLMKETLTKFIYDLYYDYGKPRIVPAEKIAEVAWKNMPGCIVRTQTDNMTIEDHYTFKVGEYMRAIQFVNRKSDTGDTGIDDSMNGYIMLVMTVKNDTGVGDPWNAEIWLFDAANLKQGPVCKLSHHQLAYGWPLHSAWLPEISSTPETYQIDVKKDYDSMIENSYFCPWKRKKVKGFFSKYVYPHFSSSS